MKRKNKKASIPPPPPDAQTPAAELRGLTREQLLGVRLHEQKNLNRPEVIEQIDQLLGEHHADQPIAIEIRRHLVRHGIRRAPGQVLRMTRGQIEEQGLTPEDYVTPPRFTERIGDRAMKPQDITTR